MWRIHCARAWVRSMQTHAHIYNITEQHMHHWRAHNGMRRACSGLRAYWIYSFRFCSAFSLKRAHPLCTLPPSHPLIHPLSPHTEAWIIPGSVFHSDNVTMEYAKRPVYTHNSCTTFFSRNLVKSFFGSMHCIHIEYFVRLSAASSHPVRLHGK